MVADGRWGNCRFCGVAVPPQSATCPICGADGPIRAGAATTVSRSVRRRVRALHFGRVLVVVVGALLLTYTLLTTVLAGPPNVPDPLTTSGTMRIPAGNYTVLSGEIDGEDYILGNFTVMNPPGLLLELTVYNSSEYVAFLNGGDPAHQYAIAPAPSGRIIFSPLYTDDYFFVFSTPYPAGTSLVVTAYVATSYNTNVVFD